MRDNPPIVIYDGFCNLCDWSVRFILKNEKTPHLYFTHLSSEKGKKIAKDFNLKTSFDGVLLLEEGKLFKKSDAALEIAKYLKFPAKLFYYFKWIPRGLRDSLYDFIAKRRYRFFGKKDQCTLIDGVADRFID